VLFALILAVQGYFLLVKDPLSITAVSRVDPSVFNTQKIVDPGVPPAIPTKYLYHLPSKGGSEPVAPPGGAAGAVAVINPNAVDRPPAAAGEGLNPASSGTPLGDQPQASGPEPIKIGGVDPASEPTLFYDTLNALIVIPQEQGLVFSAAQARQILELIRRTESAKSAPADTAQTVNRLLTPAQRDIMKRHTTPADSEATLEELMTQVLALLKAKLK